MTTRTAPPIAVLAALAFACLPLRADDDAFTRELKEAVRQLTQQGHEPVNDYPKSVMAQSLAGLLSEIGSLLLLRNEQLEKIQMPEEERIPILRQMYFQQMRRIHELEPDGNSIALYNERLQSLAFYHRGSPGGGGSVGSGPEGGFAWRLDSLLIQGRTTVDSAGFKLTIALRDLVNEWKGFEYTNRVVRGKVSHILDKEIVRPNLTGLWNPSPPTPMERFVGRDLGHLMWQIEHELTKLDAELAERKTPLKKRAKKLRRLFFEMIQKVEYVGLEVLVEGGEVKIPFRDESGPILDSAGSPIVFEVPPELTAALMMPSSNRLQLLGGGAALLLLVLAGVFLSLKRNSAKEAEHKAETE